MATTQGFRRLLAAFLAAWGVVSAGLPAARAGDWMPLLPDQDFYDFQLFAPPDLREYSIYSRPHEGIFFSYDRLYWGITVPQVTDVGETDRGGYLIPSQPISPQAIVQLNNGGIQASGTNGGSVIGGIFIYGADPLVLDLNTGWMRTAMSWGNRYEGGWIYDDRGVLISYFDSGEQSQSFMTLSEFAASSPTQIFTQSSTGAAAAGGLGQVVAPVVTTTITSNSPPPDHLISQKFIQENQTRIQSAGASMIFRRALGRRGSGSSMRFGIGPRFLQFEDRFSLNYESNQYAFNVGTGAGAGLGGGAAGGAGLGGGAGGIGGGAAGGAVGGGGSQFGGAGGGAGVGAGGLGGGFGNVGIVQTSAGDVLGISGPDSLTGIGLGSPLQVGQWETATYNNMVGPELALLLESTQGRWTWSTELKFTAGLNWQNMLYRGANFPESIGADYLRATFNPSVTNVSSGVENETVQLTPPPLFLQVYAVGQSNATNDVEHSFAFTPIGEWRLGAQFRVSQAITLRAGYTGLAMGSIARASSNTSYNGVDRRAQYAEVLDPEQPASIDNPWVVKTTGVAPPNPVPGAIYTDPDDPYFRPNPVYNQIGPANGTVQDVVFANGVDFGIEVKY